MAKYIKLEDLPQRALAKYDWPWDEWAEIPPGQGLVVSIPDGKQPRDIAAVLRMSRTLARMGLTVTQRKNVVYVCRRQEARE